MDTLFSFFFKYHFECYFPTNLETTKEKRTREMTLCKKIHARKMEDAVEVTFERGQAIGPCDKTISDLSLFLGTIARNPTFCPLIYTNWKAIPDDYKTRMLDYVNVRKSALELLPIMMCYLLDALIFIINSLCFM